jgi:hypothetical protein
MRDHVDMRAEDYDDIDETTLEVHEGHPVTMILSVPLDHDEFTALSDIAEREGKTVIDAAKDAVRAYAVARTGRAAS